MVYDLLYLKNAAFSLRQELVLTIRFFINNKANASEDFHDAKVLRLFDNFRQRVYFSRQ